MSFKEFLKEQPDDQIDTPNAGIDIYFNNLDAVTQKKVIDAVMTELNVAEDDEFANKKIVDGFAKTPLITLTGKDITSKIKFDI